MNTTNFESDNNLKSAENYYNAMLAKDFDKMTSYLHDNVHFIGPLQKCMEKRLLFQLQRISEGYYKIFKLGRDFHRVVKLCLPTI